VVAIGLIGAHAVGQTREGVLCSGLVTNAREGKTLTDDEKGYLQNWCTIRIPSCAMWRTSHELLVSTELVDATTLPSPNEVTAWLKDHQELSSKS
jgi:hypothetical protein